MREFLNILKDIKSGALPAPEVPGFLLWMAKKNYAGLWLALIVTAVVWARKKRDK